MTDTEHHATSLRITADDLAAAANDRIRIGRREARRAGDGSGRRRLGWALGLCALLVALSVTAAIAVIAGAASRGASNVIRRGGPIPAGLQGGIGQIEALALGVATVHVTSTGGLLASSGQGSAGVWSRDEAGTIRLVTNRHCLLLDHGRSREYEAFVEFRDGTRVPVSRMGIPDRNVDLAILEIDRAPADVLVLPRTATPWESLEPGADVIAVGSPLGLEETYTFGRVSARREGGLLGYTGKWIQMDAKLWPGSSGGPVFTDGPDGWAWLGVASAAGPMDVRFAIHVDELTASRFVWFSADAPGARDAARHIRSLR